MSFTSHVDEDEYLPTYSMSSSWHLPIGNLTAAYVFTMSGQVERHVARWGAHSRL